MTVDPEVAEVNALVDEFGVRVDELYEGPTEENVNAVTDYAFLDGSVLADLDEESLAPEAELTVTVSCFEEHGYRVIDTADSNDGLCGW